LHGTLSRPLSVAAQAPEEPELGILPGGNGIQLADGQTVALGEYLYLLPDTWAVVDDDAATGKARLTKVCVCVCVCVCGCVICQPCTLLLAGKVTCVDAAQSRHDPGHA
jgi:hypothetical protein